MVYQRVRAIPAVVRSGGRPDATKTTAYVLFDLALRTVSAVGLIILGIAGLQFQRTTQANARKAASAAVLERQHLPLFRAFTELELALSDTVTAVNRPHGSDPQDLRDGLTSADPARDAYVANMRDMAAQIRTAVIATFVQPTDPVSAVMLPKLTSKEPPKRIGARELALALSDMMRLVATLQTKTERERENTWITSNGGWPLLVGHQGDLTFGFPVTPETGRLLTLWTDDEPVNGEVLVRVLPSVVLAAYQHAAGVVLNLIRRQPGLADSFVAIRGSVVTEHALRNQNWR